MDSSAALIDNWRCSLESFSSMGIPAYFTESSGSNIPSLNLAVINLFTEILISSSVNNPFLTASSKASLYTCPQFRSVPDFTAIAAASGAVVTILWFLKMSRMAPQSETTYPLNFQSSRNIFCNSSGEPQQASPNKRL